MRAKQGGHICCSCNVHVTIMFATFSTAVCLFICAHLSDAGPPRISPFDFTENTIGRASKVACVSGSGNTLLWTKDGRRIFSGIDGIVIQELQGMSVLNIENLQPFHSGNYTCTATNQDGKSNFSAYLAVAAPPQWKSFPPETLILSERPANGLSCEAFGYPEVNVTWSRDGDLIHSGRILNVGPLRQFVPGKYTCHASNEHGSIQHSFTILISCKLTMLLLHYSYRCMVDFYVQLANYNLKLCAERSTF